MPAWAQIEEDLGAPIETGEMAVGERLPSERELAERFGVSRMTVRQALAALAERGLIERGVGRGTFVARPKIEHDLTRVAGFTELMERAGLEASATLRSVTAEVAAPTLARALELAEGAPLVRVTRLRSGGGAPLALEDSWFPAERLPGLAEHDLSGSLYELLRDHYDLGPVRAVERLEPVVPRLAQAQALGVTSRTPLMLVERIAYAADEVPVEFARDLHRSDRARFLVHLTGLTPPDA